MVAHRSFREGVPVVGLVNLSVCLVAEGVGRYACGWVRKAQCVGR